MDDVLGENAEWHFHVFVAIHWCAEVEVLDVKNGKPGFGSGEDTVDEELDEFKGAGGSANVTRVTDTVAGYSDAIRLGSAFSGRTLQTMLL